MYYDDLPMWSFLGKVDKQGSAGIDDYKYLLYTHIRFQILFNKDRIIDISARIRTSESVDLTEDKETFVEFFYTVYWKKVDFLFEERMAKYLVTSSLAHFAVYRLFSIIISCVTVVLSTVFLVKFYIRVLRRILQKGVCMTRNRTVTKKKEAGSASKMRYLHTQFTSHCLLQPLVLVLNY
ncbi:Nonaspanin [Parasponia andersonii]|uniref:Transmembrane 9 superfamily member n=1 Tax=Parasponia andersonii TaxID=3476 RepID=A0A2P5E118_PARAD|nr:Nonaspanin [Parasponia andersonii]